MRGSAVGGSPPRTNRRILQVKWILVNINRSLTGCHVSFTFQPLGNAAGFKEGVGMVPSVRVPTRWDLFTEATGPAVAKAVDVPLHWHV